MQTGMRSTIFDTWHGTCPGLNVAITSGIVVFIMQGLVFETKEVEIYLKA